MDRLLVTMLLLVLTTQASAWWTAPYQYPAYGYNTPWAGNYWPNAWPGYGQPHGYMRPNNYVGSDWNVRGTMSEDGDAHFIIEYHGNIYDDWFGYGNGYRPYNGFGGFPYYGNRW